MTAVIYYVSLNKRRFKSFYSILFRTLGVIGKMSIRTDGCLVRLPYSSILLLLNCY